MLIYPYKKGSKSVSALKDKLGIKEIKREGSSYKGGPNKIVINWGCTMLPDEVKKSKVINDPTAVAIAADKLKFFNHVKGEVNIPEYTEDPKVAKAWLEEGKIVLGRQKLNGHSGQGIVIFEDADSFDEDDTSVKLFVKYIPKKDEYRIHVFGDEVIDMQRKALSSEFPKEVAQFKVRTHRNGFVFVRNEVNPPQDVIDQSIKAVKACGLDFGAVDVIWNQYHERATVLEVNTAPGLEGSTVDSYEKSFQDFLKNPAWKPSLKSISLHDLLEIETESF